MIYGCDDVEFEFAVAGRLEDARVDLDLFHAGPVQFFQCRDYAGLLPGAGGTVDQEMREVSTLSLEDAVREVPTLRNR